jgi:DNA-binding transcriptional LysR family regulator
MLLRHLLREWPKLRIHIMSGSTNEILHALTMHQIGIGLIEAPSFRPDLKIEVFGEDELTLIVPHDHRWSKKPLLKAAELVQEPILLREVGSGMRRFVEEYLEQNGVLRQQLRTAIDMNSTEGIIAAVETGLGVGFVPYLALEKALKVGSIKVIQLVNGPIRRQLSIALLNGPEPRGPVGQLVELLREKSKADRQRSLEIDAKREEEARGEVIPLRAGTMKLRRAS